MGPGAVAVTTSGQHKQSTPDMLQIGFISHKKSQHLAMFKSVFPLPLRSCSVPPIFGCFIQPLQSELDGMKAATAWIFLHHDCLATAWQLLWQTSVQHILRSPTQISLVLSDRAQKCARAKKPFNLSSKAALSARIQEPRKNIFFRAKKLRDAPKKTLDLKNPRETWGLR